MTSMEPKHHFSLWYFIAVMMALIAIQSLWLTPHVLTLAYIRRGRLEQLESVGRIWSMLIKACNAGLRIRHT
jgi:hypothetical protein